MNTRLSLLGVGLAFLGLSIPTWTPAVIVSTHPDNIRYGNRSHEIAVDAGGNSYITWEGHDGTDEEVYWVKIDSSGVPGQALKISTHSECDYDDKYPQIGASSSGNSYVIWYASAGNDYEIFWVKIDSSGMPGNVQNISAPLEGVTSANWNAQIAVDASGNSYIVWQGFDGNDKEVYWAKIDTKGTPSSIHKISTHPDNVSYSDSDPQIAIDMSGNSYVVWHGCDEESCSEEPGDLEIYWVKVDASGRPGEVLKIPPTSPDNIDTMAMKPQIAVDASGNSYIVWSGKNEESNDIYWVKIDTEGNLGIVQRISAYPDSNYGDYHPQICVDVSGNLYVTWCGSDGKFGEIYWVKIDSSGNSGRVQNISNYLGSSFYDDSDPQIAVDKLGNSHVTWSSFNRGFAEKSDQQICWVKIDSSGRSGGVQRISSRQYKKHFDCNQRIVVDNSGNSYVTWEGEDTFAGTQIFFTAYLPAPSVALRVGVALAAVVAIMIIIAVAVRIIRK